MASADGFVVHSFAGDDPIVCRDYIRDRVGISAFKPNKKASNKRHNNGRGNGAVTSSQPMTQAKPQSGTQDERTMAANARLKDALAAHDAKANAGQKRTPIATFDYTDADGALLYQKLKFDSEPKYGQRRPDGNGGWISNLNGVKRVLYRLPDLIKYDSGTTIVCEGEKDANAIAALGLCATSADSGTWTPDLVEPLRNRDTVILPDFDAAGVKRALEAAYALHDVAASVRMIFLPGLTGEKGNKDVSDWLS